MQDEIENQDEELLPEIANEKRGRGRPRKYEKLESTPEPKVQCVNEKCKGYNTTIFKTFDVFQRPYFDPVKQRVCKYLRVRVRRCLDCNRQFKTLEGLDENELNKK